MKRLLCIVLAFVLLPVVSLAELEMDVAKNYITFPDLDEMKGYFRSSFAEAWNLVELPLILLHASELRPASLMLNDINSGGGNYAEAVLYALPILVLYCIVGLSLQDENTSIV